MYCINCGQSSLENLYFCASCNKNDTVNNNFQTNNQNSHPIVITEAELFFGVIIILLILGFLFIK